MYLPKVIKYNSKNAEACLLYTSGEDNVKGLVEKFKTLIENNGTVEEVNEWGKRKLAYEIDDQTERCV